MSEPTSPDGDRVRTVEVVATLSLATDMATGVPLEHGLHSALIARRLCQHLGADPDATVEAFYASLLFYIGCTASASTASRLLGADDALTRYATPVRFDRPRRMVSGMARAVAPPGRPPVIRAIALARGLPRVARALPGVVAADCDVAQMLVPRLGLP
ncbi:MAG TPA: hypothetical protein VFG97_01545, partial [Pedococcus sp.]|nr:hypothetical protein [Pedococcus sp.]